MSLKDILRGARDRRLKGGGAQSTELIANLRALRRKNLIISTFLELVVLSVVAFCAYWLTRHPAQTKQIELIAAIVIGSGGGIEGMRRIWKDWSQATLLLILLENASEAQVTTLIDKLIDRL